MALTAIAEGSGAPQEAAPRRGIGRDLGAHLPAGVLVVLTGLLALLDGGFYPTQWYPAAVFVVALGVVSVALSTRPHGLSGAFLAAVLAFAGFVAWSYLSILWADVPADAWDGANRTLLYWMVFAIVGLQPWTTAATHVVVALVALVVAGVAVVVLVRSAEATLPEGLFLEGRLSGPIGYANASAAFFLMGLWPALHVATAPGRARLLRPVALGAACLLLQTAILTQSRGAAVALAATTLAYVALTPRRWAAIAALGTLAGLAALAWDPLVAVRTSEGLPALDARLGAAREAMLRSCLAAAAIGAVAGVLGGWLWHGAGPPPRVRRVGDGVLLVLAVMSSFLAVGLVASNRPWLEQRWTEFRTAGYETVDQESTRFAGSLGSGRYDFYRVAVDDFRRHPVTGIGADNFAVSYLQRRRTLEAPQYPHSLAFRVLAQLGAVGVVLFLTFLTAAAVAVARGRSRAPTGQRAAGAAAVASVVLWLVHGMADWLWEVPALSMLALILLAIAASRDDPRRLARSRADRVLPRRLAARAALGVAAVGAGLTLAVPWLAAEYQASALDPSRVDAVDSLVRLREAGNLNPLSADPLVSAAVLERRLGRPEMARNTLQRALTRERRNWFAYFELALLEGAEGRRPQALDALARARALNPRQPLLPEVRQQLQDTGRVDADAIEQAMLGQLDARLQPTL